MFPKLRVARATNYLEQVAEMYRVGLELIELGRFEDHQGFDGIMIGSPSCAYHFEFTQNAGHNAPRSPSPELLLVFYYPDSKEWESAQNRMKHAGFNLTTSYNPYWDQCGCTFEDIEGYRVVLCNRAWNL
jgi:hypothetical protein